MKFKAAFSTAVVLVLGFTTVASAANNEFTSKKDIIESIVAQKYTGPESVNLNVSEKELKENWLPTANSIIQKDNILKDSSFKDIELNSDGSVKVTGYIGQGVKNIVKIPFFSTAYITFKPTADSGQLKIQVTKIKLGFIPVSPAIAQKLLSRWNIDINNFLVKLPNFSFDKLTVTDNSLTLEGTYSAPIKAKFTCRSGESIQAEFYKGKQPKVEPGQMPTPTGKIKVTLSDGRKFELVQTVSADGARYANSDETIMFWNKGDTMRFYDHRLEKGYFGCKTK